MPGIRLVHDRLRGVTLTVEHPTRRYKVPALCGPCGKAHERKTYHLRLDGEGAVIVSPKVFQRLREAGLQELGLQLSNTVLDPPAQRISIGQAPVVVPVEERKVRPVLPRVWVAAHRLLAPRAPKERRGQ